jgi:hypothetical protein
MQAVARIEAIHPAVLAILNRFPVKLDRRSCRFGRRVGRKADGFLTKSLATTAGKEWICENQ